MNKEGTGNTQTPEFLAQFDLGEDGYPVPGKVVKYYREQMKYTDKDGKVKHWTQADLAARLGLKEIMVNLMENKNQGLDSIERRRALATILRIPPALLGLGSLDLIVEIATGQDITSAKIDEKKSKIGRDTIELYRKTFKVYDSLFAGGLTYASINDIDRWVKKIGRDVKNVDAEDKNTLLRILWDFEILCAKVCSSDLCNWSKTFDHVDNATEIATTLDDRDLQAASLYTSGVYRFRQGRIGLARVDIDGALMYAKGALPQTKGAIYAEDAFLRSKDSHLSEVLLAQKMYDNAEKCVSAKSDIKTVRFGKGTYYLCRADTFLDVGRPGRALEFIDDSERYINPTKKRLLVYLDILRARCYIELKKPEYEQAVGLLAQVVEDSKELRIQRHIDHIDKLYGKLVQSAYGNAPDVIDLGMRLRELKLSRM